MMLRLTDLPLVIDSHSDMGKPLGAVLATATHYLTTGMLSLMSKRIHCDFSELIFPDCLAIISWLYHSISFS